MSYTPTSAGHEDAPLEQRVSFEKDPVIEALYTHVASLKTRVFPGVNDLNAYLWEFFHAHPLKQEQVRVLLQDPRFEFNGVSYAISGREYEPFRVLPYLRPIALLSCTDNILEDDGAYHQFYDLGEQQKRVLIERMPPEQISGALGVGTKKTLFIIPQEHAGYPSPHLHSRQSVLVHLGRPNMLNTYAPSVVATSCYIGCNPLMIQKFTVRGNRYDTRCRDAITQRPELHAYLRELFAHCNDPRTLHDRYGETPGPRILHDVKTLLRVDDTTIEQPDPFLWERVI